MLTIFEGARNSGKTYLANLASEHNKIPVFKFEFVDWFNLLKLEDSSEGIHLFALGKEISIQQMNREGILPDMIMDRGFLTVIVWGVLAGRITEENAYRQLDLIISLGLLSNCRIYYIHGDNPNKSDRNKDNWDFMDHNSQEKELYDRFINYLTENTDPEEFEIIIFENKFDESSIIREL
jgi:hypothetical protein